MAEEQNHRKLPYFFIGSELAERRIQDYRKNKYPVLCSQMKNSRKEDTRSIWYEKEHLELVMQEIEAYGGNGVRISFGTYEESHLYAGQTCLIFHITKAPADNSPYDYEVIHLEEALNHGERVIATALAKQAEETAGGETAGDPLTDLEDLNYGHPCPPRCDDSGTGG